MALAGVRARRGEHADAEALAREAVAIADETDWPTLRGDAEMSLASSLAAAGKRDDARFAAQAAAQLYGAKGNVVSARRAQIAAGLTTAAAAVERGS
jgi:hypothetical protein